MSPPGPPPVLVLDAVHRGYGHQRVLVGLHARLGARETVAVLGANGAGKTTLLRLAAGLLRPASGTVEGPGGARPRAGQVGYVPQDAPVYPELTCLEHMRWWGRLHRLDGVLEREVRLLDQAGLGPLLQRRAGTLSRGQRQRLALAMALLPDPPLLILDEPFTSLDAGGRGWLEEVLHGRRGRHATLVALHDAAQARRLADRVLLLHHGRLHEEGTP